jgi:hypothetical protein
MKPQWEAQIGILSNALQQFEEMHTKLPPTFPFQSLAMAVKDVLDSFNEIVGIVKSVANNEDIDPVLLAVHQPNIFNICNQIPQAMSNLIANPQAYLEQLVNYIWSIRSSIIWLIKPGQTESYLNSVTNTALLAKIELTENLYKKLFDSTQTINNSITLANQSDETIKNILNSIQGYEREAANAKTNAEASSTTALTNKDSIISLLAELSNGITEQTELLAKINELKDQAEIVLDGTSKAGLAASFGKRRATLEKAQDIWSKAFFMGITSLIVLVIATTTGFIPLTPILNTQGQIDSWSVAARVLITGPAIWFTWFAGRQYGHTMRLIEDYAFKEASALAFVGYKREMEADIEMIKLLRETAIKNFGSPPTRMLSVSEPSSPLHELVDKAFNKGGFEKVIEILKAVNPIKNPKEG